MLAQEATIVSVDFGVADPEITRTTFSYGGEVVGTGTDGTTYVFTISTGIVLPTTLITFVAVSSLSDTETSDTTISVGSALVGPGSSEDVVTCVC